jgi:uncharacterized protein (TIGR00288 family)
MNIDQPTTVAIYWDFENIHASILDQRKGAGAYKKSRFAQQDRIVDVEALMEFAASLGTVAINRAYGNWQWFAKYREALLRNAVELIQLFPPGSSAKNGADIKLCLDATEDMIRFPHITTIVIIGGDSDFLPVAQKIKAAGKTLVGIGCESTTNRHWAHSCHEFRYYEKLLIEDSSLLEDSSDQLEESENVSPVLPDPVDLVRRAIARLSANNGDPWVLKAAIRPMVKRLDPTFDEKSYGVSTFAELLKQHAAVFEVRKGRHDQEYRIKEHGHG